MAAASIASRIAPRDVANIDQKHFKLCYLAAVMTVIRNYSVLRSKMTTPELQRLFHESVQSDPSLWLEHLPDSVKRQYARLVKYRQEHYWSNVTWAYPIEATKDWPPQDPIPMDDGGYPGEILVSFLLDAHVRVEYATIAVQPTFSLVHSTRDSILSGLRDTTSHFAYRVFSFFKPSRTVDTRRAQTENFTKFNVIRLIETLRRPPVVIYACIMGVRLVRVNGRDQDVGGQHAIALVVTPTGWRVSNSWDSGKSVPLSDFDPARADLVGEIVHLTCLLIPIIEMTSVPSPISQVDLSRCLCNSYCVKNSEGVYAIGQRWRRMVQTGTDPMFRTRAYGPEIAAREHMLQDVDPSTVHVTLPKDVPPLAPHTFTPGMYVQTESGARFEPTDWTSALPIPTHLLHIHNQHYLALLKRVNILCQLQKTHGAEPTAAQLHADFRVGDLLAVCGESCSADKMETPESFNFELLERARALSPRDPYESDDGFE